MHSAARQYAIAGVTFLLLASFGPLNATDATTAASATAAATVDPIAASPWASARGHDQIGDWADLTVKGVVLRFRLILPGTFVLASPHTFLEASPTSTVRLKGFYRLPDSSCSQEIWPSIFPVSSRAGVIFQIKNTIIRDRQALYDAGFIDGTGCLYKSTIGYARLNAMCTNEELSAIEDELGRR